jgi:hypothetical protein
MTQEREHEQHEEEQEHEIHKQHEEEAPVDSGAWDSSGVSPFCHSLDSVQINLTSPAGHLVEQQLHKYGPYAIFLHISGKALLPLDMLPMLLGYLQQIGVSGLPPRFSNPTQYQSWSEQEFWTES